MQWRKKHPDYKKNWMRERIMYFKKEYLDGNLRYDDIPKSYQHVINRDPKTWKNVPKSEKADKVKAKKEALRRIIG
jgi:hypothetical protein